MQQVLTKNNFTFMDKHYLQRHGTAMGTRMAPSYACLFMSSFEERMLSTAPCRPLIWWRYIDDIFFIWTSDEDSLLTFINHINFFHSTIKFTSDYSHQQVNFLDVTVRKEHGSLSADLYTKPTDTPSISILQAANPSLQKITSNNHNILLTSDRLQRAVPEKPIIAYRRPRNLRDLLVRAAVPPLTSNPTPIQHGTFKCDRTSRCIVCSHHIVESNSITSHSMQLTHKTKGHITCTTTNVIYLISCRVCGIQYVGETKTTLKKRFYGHRSTVNTMKTETPVGEHFNLPNHTINDMSLQGIESLGSRPDLVRISRERLGCNAFAPFNLMG
ncbi:hypothetical protein BSL78_20028 [Apostichopus japonicus]|uniref:Reverse transcriptase domain-containing protein n=1 Tax=Stichopus japonicus TaxID=307972 RepID=A0A2G8K579_STIJA|nr:hypothetical protein BSL78_20028 [Apostichopus japonicus]